ncbi:cid13-like poly(A) RNA polymerase [Lasiosphaeris hirsuta]|uniref:Cid13-like poly(A) RNA polymerase n=1 Tax=Lasiosphaeris hirsuta TaxID=260670 RepID=A0AA40AFN8_9PEZI|nr:cid13-like poly(A) RNA polymerase [Lasiosphaeris hirsuta]
MEGAQDESGALEDRLRNMILHHSDKEVIPQSQSIAPFGSQPLELPPPFQSSEQAPASSKPPRKRMNQAQRRQMSAQLSIPIDTRPQKPQSARAYVSPPAFPHHQYSNGNQQRAQRPHSATFRPVSRGNTMPNALPGSTPYPPHGRHHPSLSYHGPMSAPGDHFDWRQPQPPTPFDATSPRSSRHSNANPYNNTRLYHLRPEELKAQTELLEGLCNTIIAGAEIETADIIEKESFRAKIEEVARFAITQYEREANGMQNFPPASVQLKCFGSLSSGFATKAADMDLGLISPLSLIQPDAPGSAIPRLVEKAFLDMDLGARLLTRTRVPIIKVCEKPPQALRLDLLDERAKWERGLTEDGDEDEVQEEEANPIDDVQPHDYRHHAQEHQPSPGLGRDGYKTEQKFRSLRQGEKKNLSSYYGAAKGLLRKLGGRDLTNSNVVDFKRDDFQFLNEFSLAFVEGLADDKLRERLLSYKSLNRYDLTAQSNNRTLLGVHTQVEGETMAMIWEAREVREKDDVQEQQAQHWVRAWKLLGDKPTYGLDPMGYAKELQIAVDQLKRIPSIQIMLLSQNQHESAAGYHSRAIRLMLELGCHDTTSKDNKILQVVIRHYIQGIAIEQIRREVEEFAISQPQEILTLRAVARRHKSLQLAQEFERCLEKGLYPEKYNTHIKAYINSLRSPMARPSPPDPHFDMVVPLPPEAAQAISEIRLLGDPSKLSPNQPRDPYRDRLEFPKSGVGVQCDINFSAHLALQNTLLLRCYSHCDPRVRPLVLFVKHWAKIRRINSPYRGTLSSYGYVLMMLHYLVNIAQPFVCPNLQLLVPHHPEPNLTPEHVEETVVCKGRDIQFWRDEAEIQRLARENALNKNRDSIGHLLRGFFEYYAQNNQMSTVQYRGFDWGRDVLSLRTHGGLLSKQEKGWTGAKTTIEVKSIPAVPGQATFAEHEPNHISNNVGGQQPSPGPGSFATDQPNSPPSATAIAGAQAQITNQTTREFKEVRHRYLFAIEDPFEHDHNVARTVTHNGIVSIRDEFRRAWRLIKNAGKGSQQEELLQDVAQAEEWHEREQFSQLLDEIHGREVLNY